jgi:hypothetical protein
MNFADLAKKFDVAPKKIKRGLVRGLQAKKAGLINTIRRTAEQDSPFPAVVKGDTNRSWEGANTSAGFVVGSRSWVAFWLEIGRQPGRIGTAGMERLRQWVKDVGFYSHFMTDENGRVRSLDEAVHVAANALAERITREGYRPRFIAWQSIPDFLNSIDPADLERAVDTEMA